MKSNLKYVLEIVLIILTSVINAQIKSGYTIGFNMARMKLNVSGKIPQQETMTGIHFGRIYEIPVKGNLSFQPGFLFSSKGSIYKVDTLDVALSPIYIEIPASAAFDIGSEVIKLTLFAGSYLACGIGGNIELGAEARKIRFGSGVKRDLRLFDVGMNLGAGLAIKGFIISSRYGMGLLNLSPVKTAGREMKNRVFDVSITMLFESKAK
ncbi:MAG: outer membrane beta-barrel protein [Bacteroidota bacterium]|nr:outer membrane beta-barrel protein [Bacteroidota bacterium]